MGIDDKKATELFRQYGKRLYNTALRITLSSSEAEEIMQETLIRFLTGGRRPEDEWAWLRRMCINRSIDYRLPAPRKALREYRRRLRFC